MGMNKTRLRLIGNAVRATGGIALGGLTLALYARKSTSLPTQASRPLNTIGDQENHTNCGRCIDICSQDVFQSGALFGCLIQQNLPKQNLQFAKETQR
ncbi:MAG: hypothetical protein CL797_03590 [Chromatiales bacterium]|jgi:hypothetical protein|nr:hypothetical protein [Chromatiales bacterium]